VLPLLLVLFVVVPIAELYVLWQVGDWIGILPTLALLVLDSVLGGVLVRSQGRAAWRRFNAALSRGRAPAGEAIDGALILFGGALLLTPGFLTDVLGLSLLLPPSRALVRRAVLRGAGRRIMVSAFRARRPRRSYDVDGSASDLGPRERLP
jgi:UPF0716 protein FxsA